MSLGEAGRRSPRVRGLERREGAESMTAAWKPPGPGAVGAVLQPTGSVPSPKRWEVTGAPLISPFPGIGTFKWISEKRGPPRHLVHLRWRGARKASLAG